MSEYYLADMRAKEREHSREHELNRKEPEPKKAQDMKVTLLGDFLFQTTEAQGCDPYNATNGKAARDAWRARRDRR